VEAGSQRTLDVPFVIVTWMLVVQEVLHVGVLKFASVKLSYQVTPECHASRLAMYLVATGRTRTGCRSLGTVPKCAVIRSGLDPAPVSVFSS
jgi:hypothetical protein